MKNFLKARFSFMSDSSDHTGPGADENAHDYLSIVSRLPLYLQASLFDPSCITTFPSSPSGDHEWPMTKFNISINPNSAFFRVIDGNFPSNRTQQQSATILEGRSSNEGQEGQQSGESMIGKITSTMSTTTIQYSGTLHAGGKKLQRTTWTTKTMVSAQDTQCNNCNNTNGEINVQSHQGTDTLFSVTVMTPQPSATSPLDIRTYRNPHSKMPTLILRDVRYNRVYAVQRMRSMHVALSLSLQSYRTQPDIAVYDVTESFDACFASERPVKLMFGGIFAILKMNKSGGSASGGRASERERTASFQHVKQDMELAEMLFTKEEVIGSKGTKKFCCCTKVNVKTGVDPFFPIAVALCRDEVCCFNV